MNKKLIGIIILVVIVVAFAASRLVVKNTTNETIKIGAIFSLSDYGAGWGENNLKGAELAVKEINDAGGIKGRQVELVVEDNQTNVAKTVSATRKLINVDKANFILVGWSDFVYPIIPIVDQSKIISFTVSAGAPNITASSSYLFRTWPSDILPMKTILEFGHKKGYKKIAVISTNGSWESALNDAFSAEAGFSMKVVYENKLQIDMRDFRTEILKIKNVHPDAIYVALQANSLPSFLRQASELDLSSQLIYPVDLDIKEYTSNATTMSLLRGTIYPVYKKAVTAFDENFKKAYGIMPGVSADTAYDAVKLIALAVEKTGSLDPEILKQTLLGIKDYNGASGQISFNEKKDRASADVVLMTVVGDQFVEVK